MAGTITSDANGYFEVPIPKSMATIKLFIIDENGNDNTVIYHRDKQGGHSHDNDLSAQHCPVDDRTISASTASVNKTTEKQSVSTTPKTTEITEEASKSSTEPSTATTQKAINTSESATHSTTSAIVTKKEQPQKTHGFLWIIIVLVIMVLIAWFIHRSRHRYHRKH